MRKCDHGTAVRTTNDCEICFRDAVIDRLEMLILETRGYTLMLASAVAEGDTETDRVGEPVF